VIEHARRELQKPEKERESLMVATFSAAQRDEVEDAVEIARRQDPSCEEFFKEGGNEPFEVKNLESVQGDERDVVFISVGYGRDGDGRLTNNFGPVNGEGGDRRLNVLCSRARIRCVVFTNFLSKDVAPSGNPGVRALRSFLYFAETGNFDRLPAGAGEPENEFELSVQHELIRRGFTVDAQVGCGGYRIDLAVRDPLAPGRHLLGIECDGAMYHSAKSARDRDRLRQEVLESRGWRIHRVWSTSWFNDPEVEIQRIVTAIEEAKSIKPAPPSQPEPAPPPTRKPPVETVSASQGIPYRIARLHVRLGRSQLHEVDAEKLASWLEQVVRIEQPVHFDIATRRVTTAAGVMRRGSRIVEALERAVRVFERQGKLSRKDGILTLPGSSVVEVRDRSELEAWERDIGLVAPQEIDCGIRKSAKMAHGIAEDEIPQAVARLLGLGRTSASARVVIQRRVRRLKHQGRLTSHGGYLDWADPPADA
jgi:very-short-patch-repair endonuclease